MRYVVIILSLLGGVFSGFIGMKWLGDYEDNKELIEAAKELGAAGTEMDELSGLITAAYLMLLALVLSLVGAGLTFKLKGKQAAGVLIIAGVLPIIFAAKAAIATGLLILAGVLAFAVKPKPAA